MYNPDQDLPGCMLPDGGDACGSYQRLAQAYREALSKLDEANRHAAELQRGKNEALSRLDAYEKMAAKLEPQCFEDYAAYTAKVEQERDAALLRLSRLQTALQRIVDGRFLGYVEAQEIARGALDGDGATVRDGAWTARPIWAEHES